MRRTTECTGCGLVLPVETAAPTIPMNASAECAAVYAEVSGFEFQHPVMLRYHQLSVDAYGAQHAGRPTTPDPSRLRARRALARAGARLLG